MISQRLQTIDSISSSDVICAIHPPAISTVYDSRLIGGSWCECTRTDGEMNEQARKVKRACYRMTTPWLELSVRKTIRFDVTFEGNCGRGGGGGAESFVHYFAKIKWSERKEMHFFYQSRMAQPVISNETIRGLGTNETINEHFSLLSSPDNRQR